MDSSPKQAKVLYEFGPFRLNTAERLLLRKGARVRLTRKAFDLLVVLVEANGRLMKAEALAALAWDVHIDEATVSKYVSMLRIALGDTKTPRRYIETESKGGYRFKHDEVRKLRWALAGLPFQQAGGAGTDRLGMGLASAVISGLAAMDIGDVVIRPFSAVSGYDAPGQDPFAAARELNADYAVAGRFRKTGKRVVVEVDFLRAYDREKLWTKEYSEEDTSNISVQEALGDSVARDVALHFGKEVAREEGKAEGDYTTSTEAYQLYVDGRFHWNRFTRAGFKEAINCFRQAIDIDPKYAKAYAGIADCWIWMGIYSLLPPDKCFRRAHRWAKKALSIYPGLSGAYTTLGFIEMFVRRNWVAAARHFERAIELYENNIKAHLGYSLLHMGLNDADSALAEIDKALDIFSASLINKVTKAMILYQAGRNTDALAQLDRTIKFDENFDAVYHLQSLVFAQEGDYERAIKAARTAIDKSNNNLLNHMALAYAFAKKGAKAAARRIVKRMETLEEEDWYVSPFHLAAVHCALGEWESVYRRLEQARARHDPWYIWLGTEPRFNPLHTDPQFAKHFGSDVMKQAPPTQRMR